MYYTRGPLDSYACPDQSRWNMKKLTNILHYKIFKIGAIILAQEAMENFVFPDEIKTKLMKMNTFINFCYTKELSILRERAYH